MFYEAFMPRKWWNGISKKMASYCFRKWCASEKESTIMCAIASDVKQKAAWKSFSGTFTFSWGSVVVTTLLLVKHADINRNCISLSKGNL